VSSPVKKVSGNPLTLGLGLLKMTRADFGAKYNLSKPYLLRVSQGRVSGLSDYVKRALLEEAEIRGLEEWFDLDGTWDAWVHRQRAANKVPTPTRNPAINPFARVVDAAGGVSALSKLLVVSDALVLRYRNLERRNMPEPIREALEEMGCSWVGALEKGMLRWES